MKVLLSIKPEYANKIFSGGKLYDLYFAGQGYAIKIKGIKKYQNDMELQDFNIRHAPQSFVYLT